VSFADRSDIARNPSSAFMDGSWHMAMFTSYSDVAELVHGLYFEATDARPNVASRHPLPWPNPDALAELRGMQALLGRLVGPPSAWGDIEIRSETGLQHVDVAAAHDMDDISIATCIDASYGSARLIRSCPKKHLTGDARGHQRRGGVPGARRRDDLGVIALDYTEGLACIAASRYAATAIEPSFSQTSRWPDHARVLRSITSRAPPSIG